MKKIIFPAMAALALGMASCSSDNVAPGGDSHPAFEDGGYAKVAIALPTDASTGRAANDDFNDGLASEYKVNDAALILFQGNSEDSATFHSAYKLNVSMEGYEDTPNQITSTTKIVQKLTDASTGKPLSSGDKLYAYVVINAGSNFYVGTDNVTDATLYGLKLDGKAIGDLQSYEVWNNNGAFTSTSNGLLMCNAPLATAQGGAVGNAPAADVKTLVDFTDAVKKTEAEAQNSPATDVYVERAVAKVTMHEAINSSVLKSSEVKFKGSDAAVKVELKGWALDVTNKLSYLARKTVTNTAWNALKSNSTISTAANYRFIGNSVVKGGSNLYRTYWAEDPNYALGAALDKSQFTFLNKKDNTFSTLYGDDNPTYCMENTFDVANQNQDQTTRVIAQVQIGDGSDFYTFNGDRATLYYAGTCEARVKEAICNVINAKNGNNNVKDADITFSVDNLSAADGDNVVTVTDFTVTGYNKTSDDIDAVNKALGTITKYAEGIAYYPIRIKHFGDDLTPWNDKETALPVAGSTTDQIYPVANRANNYLGRYGVLRNNWYDVAINSISGVGTAIVPPTENIPDDELYNYIAVRINILSWAKRGNVIDL